MLLNTMNLLNQMCIIYNKLSKPIATAAYLKSMDSIDW